MRDVNYDEISIIYDDVRQADIDLIQNFMTELSLNASTTVLDLGCGTGNYLDVFQHNTPGQFYGVEPSSRMRLLAQQKNPNLTIKDGDAYHVPFGDGYFDFVYMTDVIHHIDDLSRLFAELHRVLKSAGRICIVTQSHQQIAQRPITKFFPETIAVDQARYPTIDTTIQHAAAFTFMKTTTIQEHQPIVLGADFLELVQKKGYSMLHLISDEAYKRGLHQLESTLQSGDIEAKTAGSTLIWLEK